MTDDTRLAIIVNPALSLGLVANTVGAISIGLGARMPALAARRLTDRESRTIDISSILPIPILQAEPDTIRALMLKALLPPHDRAVVPFPAFARSLHDYRDYESAFPGRDLADEEIDGLGLVGPSTWVRSLTGSLRLLR